MKIKKPHIAILGAGPAGLGAAYYLTKAGKAQVTVIEAQNSVGGNSGSFEFKGLYLDYGSHRLHPSTDPDILHDLRSLLKDDLRTRPRHGRIRLKNRWIHFPLKPFDLAAKLPPSFPVGVLKDKLFPRKDAENHSGEDVSFAGELQATLGNTICREFYFPYAKKIWGLPANEISAVQAQKRVSANNLRKLIRKVFSRSKGNGGVDKSIFYYPRLGFGQISNALHQSAEARGAQFILNAPVTKLEWESNRIKTVTYNQGNRSVYLQPDYVWSTLPVSLILRLMNPSAPPETVEAAQKLEYRSMLLIYLILDQAQFTEYDAHYFPSEDIPITRLSEPKNYSGVKTPENRTALCAELPCSMSDALWEMPNEELRDLVLNALKKAGIPVKSAVLHTEVRRLKYAYPIYKRDFDRHLSVLDRSVAGFSNLLTFGRQGLFVHDNTHHALFMARSAVFCLDEDGHFNLSAWQQFRKIFATHVVED